MDVIQYLDMESMEWKTRPCTPEEQAEIDARRTAEPTAAEHNAPILAELERIDLKTIRPLREGDTERVEALKEQAAQLRAQLRKD